MLRSSALGSFSKSQVSSLIATTADYALLFSLVEFFHVWYVTATALGSLLGAITNFLLNRHWSFRATHRRWRGQAYRYSLISATSLVLNSGGVYLFTEYFRFHYSVSVVFVSVLVGIFFNFPLHKIYVFK